MKYVQQYAGSGSFAEKFCYYRYLCYSFVLEMILILTSQYSSCGVIESLNDLYLDSKST